MIIVFYFILGLSGLIIGFLNLNPQFGGNPNSDQKKIYSQYANYKNNEFINIEETIMMTGEMPMSEFFKNDSNKTPNKNIPFEYINIKFLNDENLSTRVKILTDGSITLPLVDPIFVSGLTIKEATKKIVLAMSSEIIKPIVQITIDTFRPIRVSVIGEFKNPGIYNIYSFPASDFTGDDDVSGHLIELT